MNPTANFNEQVKIFERLLDNVAVEKISPDTYCQKYLGHLLEHKKYYLAIYADVIEKLNAQKNIDEIALVDFGAGNGLLGIFAKFCGCKKVYLVDIDEKFITASQNLAQQMNINIDGYIRGDIHALQQYFNDIIPDAIIATDVIEHIYSLEDFFGTIKKINPSIISVFTTASNPENYFKVRNLKKLQIKDECEGGTPDDFVLFGDKPLEAFFKIRLEIIRSQLGNVNEKLLTSLAKATRGMNEQDISIAVENYKLTKKIPDPPLHPTNTCNPLNSSWTERILPISAYYSIYNENKMNLRVYNGFYNEFKKGLGGVLNKLLNKGVTILGRQFAPYIIFVGTKK